MKKLLCLIIVCTNIFSNTVYAADDAEELPSLDAKGAVLMEFDTGRVVFEKDADLPLSNASTTKIMTAIIALEKCGLNDVVTASKNAAATPPVKMYLEAGEKQTMQDLLYALMLESANDAAVAIAEHVGGSVEGFAALMNKKAKELGALNTEFVTPNGLDSGNHHSTARDMAIIARHALSNKDFRRIISTPSITTPVNGGNFKQHSFVNKDRLLSEYDGALGIKTGYTGLAGHCFVGAAKRDGMLLISVVLGSGWGSKGKEQKWIDTKNLLSYGFDNYKYVTIAKEGETVKSYEVLNSKKSDVALKLASSLSLPLSESEIGKIEMRYTLPEIIDAPIKRGDKLGYAEVIINGKSSAEIDICADRSVERCDFKISMGKILDGWLNMKKEDLIKMFN